MKHLALLAIRLYQRFVSPWKGFRCAYRVHVGAAGCSALGYRAIRRYGLLGGTGVLRLRLALCADCHAERRALPRRRLAELGSCDAPCDLPCDHLGVCECLDCGDCDWGRRKANRPTREQRKEARRRIPEQARRRAGPP